MKSKKLISISKITSALLLVLFLWACTEDISEDSDPSNSTPWNGDFLFGNFGINSLDILSHGEGNNGNYYTYYVTPDKLPQASFEFYSMNVWVPTNTSNYFTGVNNAGAFLYYGNDNVSISIDDNSGFVDIKEVDGQTYSVYKLLIRDTYRRASPSNFDKIVYAFNITYRDRSTDRVVYDETYNVEFYKEGAVSTSGGSSGSSSGGSSSGGSSGGSSSGNLTFWVQQDLGCGYLYVSVAGAGSKTMSSYYSGNPGCGAAGCANFTNLTYGTYQYSVTSDGDCTWNGSVIVDDACTTLQLTE